MDYKLAADICWNAARRQADLYGLSRAASDAFCTFFCAEKVTDLFDQDPQYFPVEHAPTGSRATVVVRFVRDAYERDVTVAAENEIAGWHRQMVESARTQKVA